MAVLEVVTDRALIDDEDRPGVMGVPGIRVLDEPGVEDLVDAGHRRLPGANPFAWRRHEVPIVQDLRMYPGLGCVHVDTPPGRTVSEFVGFLGFAFVGTVSPGPNNTVLWASGLRFGFRRTLPHVLGTALGMGLLVVGIAAGIGAVLEAVPSAVFALKLAGSAYLLYIAYRVLGGGVVGRAEVSNPLSLWQALTFQWVNPKAWIFSLAAVGTFLSPDLHRTRGRRTAHRDAHGRGRGVGGDLGGGWSGARARHRA